MLCHEYKCIFVHIPKTAGQSIEHVFLRRLGLTWETRAPLLLRPNNNPKLGPPALAHLTASEYITCGHVTPEQFDSYFKFSFVRNPWARIVSEYKYRGYPKKIDFKTYLFKHLPKPGWSDEYRHIMPQYNFLYDEKGKLLVDFVGKFENLQNDFYKVCKRLGFPPITLPHANKSLKSDKHISLIRRIKKIISVKNILSNFKVRKNTFQHDPGFMVRNQKNLVKNYIKKILKHLDINLTANTL